MSVTIRKMVNEIRRDLLELHEENAPVYDYNQSYGYFMAHIEHINTSLDSMIVEIGGLEGSGEGGKRLTKIKRLIQGEED